MSLSTHKKAGIVAATFLVCVVILLALLSRISIKRKDVVQPSKGAPSPKPVTVPKSVPTDSGVGGWVELDNSTLVYSDNAMEVNGVVSNKKVFRNSGGQLIYLLEVTVVIGEDSVVLEQYCSYGVYTSIALSDVVKVKYIMVSDSLVAIVGVYKVE